MRIYRSSRDGSAVSYFRYKQETGVRSMIPSSRNSIALLSSTCRRETGNTTDKSKDVETLENSRKTPFIFRDFQTGNSVNKNANGSRPPGSINTKISLNFIQPDDEEKSLRQFSSHLYPADFPSLSNRKWPYEKIANAPQPPGDRNPQTSSSSAEPDERSTVDGFHLIYNPRKAINVLAEMKLKEE